MVDGALVQIAQNCCGILFFGDIQKLNEKGPGHPALDVPVVLDIVSLK